MEKTYIGISIPCYNEEDNIENMVREIERVFREKLPDYKYKIQFIDNASTDRSRQILEKICAENENVSAIFNARNFGGQSGYYSLMQAPGDCVVTIPCDFQVPVEMIPDFIKEWENGAKIVCAIKNKSKENFIMREIRQFYYYLITKFSQVPQIANFTGSGLYDRNFIEICRAMDDPSPSMRGIVAEFGYNVKFLYFTEPKRRAGRTKQSFFTLFDVAMRNFTTYTKIIPRFATFFGILCSSISFLTGFIYLILKLVMWNNFIAGMGPLVVGIFFVGGIQILFLGLLGEYLLSINQRIMKKPLVIEEKRINFGKENVS